MKDIAIKVENLSKAYQIGDFSTGTLSRDIERWWAGIRGKEDPFLKIGETNDRTSKGTSDVVWSLRDINFEIKRGDAVGIIGRNGAGKSTLLKILSRVTAPTTGDIKVKGRIASLLEVGTGFHPELTGKENIYLNGAILGMRKTEIRKRFNAIVEFAGVERYIDTPVKRYSSGMYVRLAFAVAAHLESEILIVDEVLAVGDAEFQQKCIGKLDDVSKESGRTILFVSHNMGMISQLCNKSIYLKNGEIVDFNRTDEVVNRYLAHSDVESVNSLKIDLDNSDHDEKIFLKTFEVLPFFKNSNDFPTTAPIKIQINFEILKPYLGFRVGFEVTQKSTDQCVFRSFHDDSYEELQSYSPGVFRLDAAIPGNLLSEGEYTITPAIGIHNVKWLNFRKQKIVINIVNIDGINRIYSDKRPGVIAPKINWESYAYN